MTEPHVNVTRQLKIRTLVELLGEVLGGGSWVSCFVFLFMRILGLRQGFRFGGGEQGV